MNTGENSQALGLYCSNCCEWERTFDKGECFSRCPGCAGLCDWELLEPPRPLVPPLKIKDTEHKVF